MDHVIVCIVLAVAVLGNGQQVTLTPPTLEEGRETYCVGDDLVFTCTGTASAVLWTVSPFFVGEAFVSTDPVNSSREITGVDATLTLQQVTPVLISTLRIRNVPDVQVSCLSEIPGSTRTESLTSSSIPPAVTNVTLTSMTLTTDTDAENVPVMFTVTWEDAARPSYDLRHYCVKLCTTSCIDMDPTRERSITITEMYSNGAVVNAEVAAVSECNDVGGVGRSNDVNVVVLRIFYQNLIAVIILGVVCGLLILVVFGLSGWIIWKCCCEERKCSVCCAESEPAADETEMKEAV